MTTEQRLSDFAVAVGTDIKDLRQKVNTHVFPQMVPSTSWLIQHNLDKFPSVDIVDSAETKVHGSVTYVDRNNILVEFSFPFSGKAYLN